MSTTKHKNRAKQMKPGTYRFKCVYESRHTRDLTVDQIMQNGGEAVMCECGGPMFMQVSHP